MEDVNGNFTGKSKTSTALMTIDHSTCWQTVYFTPRTVSFQSLNGARNKDFSQFLHCYLFDLNTHFKLIFLFFSNNKQQKGQLGERNQTNDWQIDRKGSVYTLCEKVSKLKAFSRLVMNCATEQLGGLDLHMLTISTALIIIKWTSEQNLGNFGAYFPIFPNNNGLTRKQCKKKFLKFLMKFY